MLVTQSTQFAVDIKQQPIENKIGVNPVSYVRWALNIERLNFKVKKDMMY